MKQKIMRSGGSLVVTIPAFFVNEVGIRVGDQVEVQIAPGRGQVVYKFSGAAQLPLSKNLLKKKMASHRIVIS